MLPGYEPVLLKAYSVLLKVTTQQVLNPGPEVIKLFSCSAQLRLKFILLINVKLLAF